MWFILHRLKDSRRGVSFCTTMIHRERTTTIDARIKLSYSQFDVCISKKPFLFIIREVTSKEDKHLGVHHRRLWPNNTGLRLIKKVRKEFTNDHQIKQHLESKKQKINVCVFVCVTQNVEAKSERTISLSGAAQFHIKRHTHGAPITKNNTCLICS